MGKKGDSSCIEKTFKNMGRERTHVDIVACLDHRKDHALDFGSVCIPDIMIPADVDWTGLKQTRLDPFLKRLRQSLALATAKGASYTVHHAGAEPVARVTKVLMGMNLEEFCRDVVIFMVENQDQKSVAKVQHKAISDRSLGAEQLVQQLTVALLCSGHVEHAALVTNEFVAECRHQDWSVSARQIAEYIAPAVILAVDCGHGDAVAFVQSRMIDDGHIEIVTQLILYIASNGGRPDVVAQGTLDAIQCLRHNSHGIQMAASVAAGAFCGSRIDHGETNVMGHVACEMYLESQHDLLLKEDACKTIALAALRGVEVYQNPLRVVKVSYFMWKEHQGHAITRAFRHMVAMRKVVPIAMIALTAITHGYIGLTCWLLKDMLLSGYWYSLLYSLFACVNVMLKGGSSTATLESHRILDTSVHKGE